jgi:hypothetical protein
MMLNVDFTSGVYKSRSLALRGTNILYVLPNILRSITRDFAFCHHFGATILRRFPYFLKLLCIPTACFTMLEGVHIGYMNTPIKS